MPWWVVAAASDPHFAHDVVVTDWLRWYLPQRAWNWQAVIEAIEQPVKVLLPWVLLLPWALWFTTRTTDPELARRVRLPLVWASVIFIGIALSHKQFTRYYLPLCPPVALLIAAWYSRLALRHQHAIGATVWLIVAIALTLRQGVAGPRHNAGTDLGPMVSLTATRAKPVYVVGVPELPLAFYLKQPVAVLRDYRTFEALVREGREGWLAIDDRALPVPSTALRLPRLGGGRMSERSFSVLAPAK